MGLVGISGPLLPSEESLMTVTHLFYLNRSGCDVRVRPTKHFLMPPTQIIICITV